jgi:FkbM family methyltransferase
MGELLEDLVDSCLNFKNGFYIEAGANNGVRQSNTIFLEKMLGWKGILIEPNTKKIQICKQNRSSTNLFYNCALVGEETTKTIWGNFDEDDIGESLMACSSVLLEYYDENFKQEIISKSVNRKQIQVPARTLDSILEENNIKHVDFFSLDLEGYELEAIKNFRFDRYKIDYILVETASRLQYQKMMFEFMTSKGYTYYKKVSNNDDLYKRSEQ